MPWNALQRLRSAVVEPQTGTSDPGPFPYLRKDLRRRGHGDDARPDVGRYPAEVVRQKFDDLARVETGADLHAGGADGGSDLERAAHGADRAVKQRNEPVARGDDLSAPWRDLARTMARRASRTSLHLAIAQGERPAMSVDPTMSVYKTVGVHGRRLGRAGRQSGNDLAEDRLGPSTHHRWSLLGISTNRRRGSWRR